MMDPRVVESTTKNKRETEHSVMDLDTRGVEEFMESEQMKLQKKEDGPSFYRFFILD